MMSLTEANVWDISKKQYLFKIKAYTGAYAGLILMQLIASLFSLGGLGYSGTTVGDAEILLRHYTSDLIIIFTLLWAFIIGISITQKSYRYADFAFVSNRFTSHLSNSLFLLTISIIGGISTILTGNVLKVILYFYIGREYHVGDTLLSPPTDLLLGMVSTSLYILLLSLLGYFFGMLVQLHKGFIFLLIGFFIGIIFIDINNQQNMIIYDLIGFYILENSFLFFLMKTLFSGVFLFGCTLLISNRMEVRE